MTGSRVDPPPAMSDDGCTSAAGHRWIRAHTDTDRCARCGMNRNHIPAPRVAVVRPPDDATTPQNADSWWAEKCWRCGCRRDDHAQDGSCYTESDEKFVGSEAAAVRPTRDQIAAIIAWPWPPGSPPPHRFSDIVPTKKDFDAADALLAAFWPEPEGNTS